MLKRGPRVAVAVAALLAAAIASGIGGSLSAHAASPATTVVKYDTFSSDAPGGYTLTDYGAKWSNPFLLGDMAVAPGDTRRFDNKTFYIDDAPFRTSNDFSVYDHLKHIAISNESFPVPAIGSVTFTSDITAETPGAAVKRRHGPRDLRAAFLVPERRAVFGARAAGPAGRRCDEHGRLRDRAAL